MRYSTDIKPASYLAANTDEVLDTLEELREPLIITRDGEAKAILQDIRSYEQTQETLALLQLLMLSRKDVEAGRTRPLRDVLEELKQRSQAA